VNGLNLGLAINIADNATVNANKISSSIDKLMKLVDRMPGETTKATTSVDHLNRGLGTTTTNSNRAGAGISSFSRHLQSAEPHLFSFRAGVIRLFPYVSLLGGIYAVKRGLTDVIGSTREFYYSLANMQAATGFDNNQMKMLEMQMRSMAVTGRFSAKEIADASYDLSTTMPIPAEQLSGLTKAVLNYATATQFGVQESGQDMLSLLARLNRPVSDATILFDQMALATNITSLNARRLSEMLKVVGTEATTMGVPFNQLLALMGTADLYYKGGEGGTRLRMMFQMLAEGTKMHEAVLGKYGLTLADVDIKSQGLIKVMQRLRVIPYGDLTRIVGGYSAGLIIRLSADTKKIAKLQEQFTEELAKGTGQRMSDVQMATLDGKMKRFQNILTEFRIGIGDSLQGPLMKSYDKTNDWLTSITTKIQQNKGVLDTMFGWLMHTVDKIGEKLGGWIQAAGRWSGLLADSVQESQAMMKAHLIPFIVFLEVMRIRVASFLEGFGSGFIDTFGLAYRMVNMLLTPFAWLIDTLIPNGNDGMNTAGYLIGVTAAAMTVLTAGTWLLAHALAAVDFALSPMVWPIALVMATYYAFKTLFKDVPVWMKWATLFAFAILSFVNPLVGLPLLIGTLMGNMDDFVDSILVGIWKFLSVIDKVANFVGLDWNLAGFVKIDEISSRWAKRHPHPGDDTAPAAVGQEVPTKLISPHSFMPTPPMQGTEKSTPATVGLEGWTKLVTAPAAVEQEGPTKLISPHSFMATPTRQGTEKLTSATVGLERRTKFVTAPELFDVKRYVPPPATIKADALGSMTVTGGIHVHVAGDSDAKQIAAKLYPELVKCHKEYQKR